MKKFITLLLGVLLVLTVAGCQKQEPAPAPEPEPAPEPAPTDEVTVMSYADYAAAEIGAAVTVEGYVQAAQSYWNGAKLYVQDQDGAYFVYCDGKGEDVNISEEDYAKLVPSTDYSAGWTGLCDGTKVQVSGVKAEWSGEVEISEATVTILDGDKWVAEAEDVTAILADADALAAKMNKKVKFTDLTVAPSTDAEGKEVAFLYNWDGSGEAGSDLYFNVTDGTNTYNFVVESYLCYDGSDVYEAVEALNVGDVVDLEGFLYWYNGANPHITSVTVK